MFHKPETSLSWKECLNQPQVGFASFFFMLGVVSQPPETFPTAQGKEFKQTPPFMDQHHFQPQKHDPSPQKKTPQIHRPKKKIHPAPCRPHWRHPHHGSSPRVKSPLEAKIQPMVPGKTTRLCTRFNFQSILVEGFFLEDSRKPLFLETTSFGGSENLMVGDYTLLFEGNFC